MEKNMNEKIKRFLETNSGSGDGSGSGYGSSSGSGYGSGYGFGPGYGDGSDYGDGCGSGYGSGYGDGCGYGDGDGINTFCGRKVYKIDGVQTVIKSIYGDVARGEIINKDLTTTPCYIAKRGNCFAHGKTLSDAVREAEEKLFDDMPEDERIEAFWKCHERGVKYPAMDLYSWHNRLTGSCEMGRKAFAADNGVDLEKDMFTVEEFVQLCGNSYGGNVIKELLKG